MYDILAMLIAQILTGLTFAMLLYLIASGLTLILGIIDVVNFAHGSLYMLGAYAMYTATQYMNFYAALLLAPIIVGIIGFIIEKYLIKYVYKGGHILQLLLTYGLVLFLADAVKYIYSGEGQEFVKSVSLPANLEEPIYIMGKAFPIYYCFVIGVGFLVAIFLWWLIESKRWGSIIRAAASNKAMLNALGYNVNRIYTAIFVLGVVLAGLGGALASPVRAAYPGMGVEVVVASFIVVIIGGFGSMSGALIAAIIIGQLEVFGMMYAEELSMVVIYLILLIVIVVKPSGIFGKKIGEF